MRDSLTVGIQPFAKGYLTLSQAARRLPRRRRGRPVSPATLWRWYKHGIKARSGETVRLQVWKIGGQTFTSEEALRVFSERLSTIGCYDNPVAAPSTKADFEENVEAQLDALGVR
jgi:hypothetical protein